MAMDMLYTSACRYSSVCIALLIPHLLCVLTLHGTVCVCLRVCCVCEEDPLWPGSGRCAVTGRLISSLCFACQTSAGNRAIVGWKPAGPEDPAYRLLSPPCSRHPALPFGATVICSRLLQNRVSSVQMGWQGFKYCSRLLSSDQLKLPFS